MQKTALYIAFLAFLCYYVEVMGGPYRYSPFRTYWRDQIESAAG